MKQLSLFDDAFKKIESCGTGRKGYWKLFIDGASNSFPASNVVIENNYFTQYPENHILTGTAVHGMKIINNEFNYEPNSLDIDYKQVSDALDPPVVIGNVVTLGRGTDTILANFSTLQTVRTENIRCIVKYYSGETFDVENAGLLQHTITHAVAFPNKCTYIDFRLTDSNGAEMSSILPRTYGTASALFNILIQTGKGSPGNGTFNATIYGY